MQHNLHLSWTTLSVTQGSPRGGSSPSSPKKFSVCHKSSPAPSHTRSRPGPDHFPRSKSPKLQLRWTTGGPPHQRLLLYQFRFGHPRARKPSHRAWRAGPLLPPRWSCLGPTQELRIGGVATPRGALPCCAPLPDAEAPSTSGNLFVPHSKREPDSTKFY